MKIEVLNGTDGTTIARCVNPETNELTGAVPITAGQKTTISLPDVHDAAGVQFGEVEPIGEEIGEEQPAPGGGGAEEPPAPPVPDPAPPAEAPLDPPTPTDSGEIPAGLGIGRIVIYRLEGGYDFPAIVTHTSQSINAGRVPELTAPNRVHLTVFSCCVGADVSHQEFNVPQFVVEEIGADQEAAEVVAGTWRWPERV